MLAQRTHDDYLDEALHISEMPLYIFSHLTHDAIISVDEGMIITFWNREAERVFGYTPEEAVGQPLILLIPERFHSAHQHGLERSRQTGHSLLSDLVLELIGRRKDGKEFPIELSLTAITSMNGRCYYAIIRDITQRKQMEQDLRQSEERYRMVVSNMPIILFALDASGVITLSEGQGLQAFGPRPGVVGRSVFEVYRDFPQLLDALRRALSGEAFSCVNKIGDLSFDTHYTPLRDARGQLTGVTGLAIDVSQRVQAEERLRHLALHDTLTSLPNRLLLQERLEQFLASGGQGQRGVALLLLSVNRFKEINDTFGHQHGDQLLQRIAMRLSDTIGSTMILARLAGDTFAIMLPLTDKAEVCALAMSLQNSLKEPFTVTDLPLHIDMSIGIALAPEHGTDATTLIRRADIAMSQAKRTQEGYALYDARDDQYSPQRLLLVGALRHAITNRELQLYYQPKACLKTGEIHSVEALTRWHHSEFGFVPPDQFIPLAEQTGLIVPLTLRVLETAIRQCSDWYRQGLKLKMAVNLSIWNLRDTMLPGRIAALLKQHHLPARMFCVEVTESTLMTNGDIALDVLRQLFEQGIFISIDDFGTGYSSLAYLKHLPVDELKIDRSFIQHLATTRTDIAIVRSTVIMAHSLGLSVVAEGVEDQPTWNLLTTLGCDTAQGYYLSRPVAAQELENWLQKTKQGVA